MKRGALIWSLIGALALLDVGVGIWYYIESGAEATASSQVESTQMQLQSVDLTNMRLQKKVDALPKADAGQKILPNGPDQSGLLSELRDVAANSGVTIRSITFSDVTGQANSGAGTSTAGSNNAATQQSTEVSNEPAVQTQIVVNGTESSLLNFDHQVQSNPRYAVVESATLSITSSESTLTLSVNFPYHL